MVSSTNTISNFIRKTIHGVTDPITSIIRFLWAKVSNTAMHVFNKMPKNSATDPSAPIQEKNITAGGVDSKVDQPIMDAFQEIIIVQNPLHHEEDNDEDTSSTPPSNDVSNNTVLNAIVVLDDTHPSNDEESLPFPPTVPADTTPPKEELNSVPSSPSSPRDPVTNVFNEEETKETPDDSSHLPFEVPSTPIKDMPGNTSDEEALQLPPELNLLSPSIPNDIEVKNDDQENAIETENDGQEPSEDTSVTSDENSTPNASSEVDSNEALSSVVDTTPLLSPSLAPYPNPEDPTLNENLSSSIEPQGLSPLPANLENPILVPKTTENAPPKTLENSPEQIAQQKIDSLKKSFKQTSNVLVSTSSHSNTETGFDAIFIAEILKPINMFSPSINKMFMEKQTSDQIKKIPILSDLFFNKKLLGLTSVVQKDEKTGAIEARYLLEYSEAQQGISSIIKRKGKETSEYSGTIHYPQKFILVCSQDADKMKFQFEDLEGKSTTLPVDVNDTSITKNYTGFPWNLIAPIILNAFKNAEGKLIFHFNGFQLIQTKQSKKTSKKPTKKTSKNEPKIELFLPDSITKKIPYLVPKEIKQLVTTENLSIIFNSTVKIDWEK